MATVAQHIPVSNLHGLGRPPPLHEEVQGDEVAVSQRISPSPLVPAKPSPPPIVAKKPDMLKRTGVKLTPPPAPERSSSISVTRGVTSLQTRTVSVNDIPGSYSNLDKSDRQRGSRTSPPSEHAHDAPRETNVSPNSRGSLNSYNSRAKEGRKLHSILSASQPQLNKIDKKSLGRPRDRLTSILVGDSNEEDEASLKDDYGSSYNSSLMKISHGDVQKHTVAVTTPIVPFTSPSRNQASSDHPNNVESSQVVAGHPPVNVEEQTTPQERPRLHTSPFHQQREESNDVAASTEMNQLSLSNPISRAYRQHLMNKMEQNKQLGLVEQPLPTSQYQSNKENVFTRSLDQIGELESPTLSSTILNLSPSQLQALDMPDSACYPRILPPPNSKFVSGSAQVPSTNNIFNDGQRHISSSGHDHVQAQYGAMSNTTPPSIWEAHSYIVQNHRQPTLPLNRSGSPSILESVKLFEQAHNIAMPSGKSYGTLPRSHHQQHHKLTSQVLSGREEIKKRAKSIDNLMISHEGDEAGWPSSPNQSHSSLSPSAHRDVVCTSGSPQGVNGMGEWNGKQFYKQNGGFSSSSCSSSSPTIPTAVTTGHFTSNIQSPGSHLPDRTHPISPQYSPDPHQSARIQSSQYSPSKHRVAPSVSRSPVHPKRIFSVTHPSNHERTVSMPSKASSCIAAQERGLNHRSRSLSDKEVYTKDSETIIEKAQKRKMNPNEFLLSDYISYHSVHLPKRVQITKGFCSDSTEVALSQGEVFDLHFVRQTKTVMMTDSNMIQYTVPMSSLAMFSILYDPFEVERVAILGFHFKTAGAVMDLKNPPAVMASTREVDGGRPDTSLKNGEVLIIQGVKNVFHGRLLRVFSLKTNSMKFLDDQCAADFTTNPTMIKMTLPQIYDCSIPLPQKAILYPSDTMANSIPSSLLKNTFILKKFTIIKSVVATALAYVEMTSSSECPVLDLDVSLDVDIQEVAIGKSEQKEMLNTTQNLVNRFDESAVVPYVDMPDPSLHIVQCALLTNLNPKLVSYTTEIFPPDEVLLPKTKIDIRKTLSDSGPKMNQEPDARREQRLKTIEAKQEKIESKVSSICDRLDEVSHKMEKVYTYLNKAQLAMNEHKRKQSQTDQPRPRSVGGNRPIASHHSGSGGKVSSSLSEASTIDSPPIRYKFNSSKLVPGKAQSSKSKLHSTSSSMDENNDEVFVVKSPKPPILPKPKILQKKKKDIGGNNLTGGQTTTNSNKTQKDNKLAKGKEPVKRCESGPLLSMKDKRSSTSRDAHTLPSFTKKMRDSIDLTDYLIPESPRSNVTGVFGGKSQTSTQSIGERSTSAVESVGDIDITDWCSQIEDELTKLYNDSILS